MTSKINVIDLFAGPGGLGEGFSAFKPTGKNRGAFCIRMSVEKEASAHKTLSLRALYRNLKGTRDINRYHDYLTEQKCQIISNLRKHFSQTNQRLDIQDLASALRSRS